MIDWLPVLRCWGFNTPEQLFRWLYIDQQLSISQINRALGINGADYYLHALNIKTRPRGRPKKIPDDAHLVIDKLGIKGAADVFNVSYEAVRQWRERNDMRPMSLKDFDIRSWRRPAGGEDNDRR